MSGALHALAWAKAIRSGVHGEKLTPSAKLALVCLADYQGRNGWAWPSIERLAADCLVGTRQMHNLLVQLETAGLIEVSRRSTPWGGNRYRVLVGAIAAPTPDVPEEHAAAVEELSSTEVRTALIDELLPVLLAEADTPAAGYLAALDAADQLAADNADLSPELPAFLRNAVLVAAAEQAHNIEPKSASRLLREAKTLGADGHRWISAALWHTASADVTGDPCSYVIATARRLKADRSQGVTA